MVERQQVIFPLGVDDVEHDDPLIGAHRLRTNLLLLLSVLDLELLPDVVGRLLRGEAMEIETLLVRVEIVDGLNLNLVVVDVPVVRRNLRIQILLRQVRQ